MSDAYWMLALIAWFVSAVVGAIIGAEKGKTGKGALLGFLFGPVGWILMMLDAGFIWAFLCFVIAGTIFFAAMAADQRDWEKMQLIKTEERRANTAYELDRQFPEPVTEASPLPTATPTPAPGILSQFPPGVDTPEQRREFLLRRIEAQKAAKRATPYPVPPADQRTSNRTRGY